MALFEMKKNPIKVYTSLAFLAFQVGAPSLPMAQTSLITTQDPSAQSRTEGGQTPSRAAAPKKTKEEIGPEAQFRLNALKEELSRLQNQQGQKIRALRERVRFLESQVQMLRGWSDKTIQAMREKAKKRAQASHQEAQNGSGTTLSASEKAYRTGFDLLLSGQYQEATQAFESYLQKYPDASRRVNAIYWIGEAYYVEEKYQQAIAQYDIILEDHPESSKARPARFKRAYSYYNLQDYRAARKDLLAVLEQSQDSKLKSEARNLLDKIRYDDLRAAN